MTESVESTERAAGSEATLTDIAPTEYTDGPYEGPIGKWLFDVLKELKPSELGIAQIYWLLERLAEANSLTDVVAILTHPVLGPQLFRLGAAAIDRDTAMKFGGEPGVYCDPDIAPPEERDVIHQLCQIALSQHQFRFNATHDALTNVSSRWSFEEALKTAAANSARHGWAFALVLLDLNQFKKVNDEHGHDEGDRVLKQVGLALRKSIREGDVAARMGGDEFVLILNNAETAEADMIVSRVRSQLQSMGTFIDFANGRALAPKQSTDPLELYRIADEELRRHKGDAR
ncbi:MAG TPA: GGDEF domain-containing protein [Acidimicrobiales bacterium]|nr:GGDEF domain-containing protein [Acidimicrobiales bacterium]